MDVDVAAFAEPNAVKARARDLLERITASPLAEGATEILIAGEQEQRAVSAFSLNAPILGATTVRPP